MAQSGVPVTLYIEAIIVALEIEMSVLILFLLCVSTLLMFYIDDAMPIDQE